MNGYVNLAALRAAVFPLSAKNRWGISICACPPVVRGLTLARSVHFSKRGRLGWGGVRPPCDRPQMVVELYEKIRRCVWTRSRECTYFFSLRSTFGPVRSGQKSNILEKWDVLAIHAHTGVRMCRSDLKTSPACSLFNSQQVSVLLLYTVAIFIIRSVPK